MRSVNAWTGPERLLFGVWRLVLGLVFCLMYLEITGPVPSSFYYSERFTVKRIGYSVLNPIPSPTKSIKVLGLLYHVFL